VAFAENIDSEWSVLAPGCRRAGTAYAHMHHIAWLEDLCTGTTLEQREKQAAEKKAKDGGPKPKKKP
jgi:hypothetical protein